MNISESHQQWLKTLESEFEKQKQLWTKSAVEVHQKKIRKTQCENFAQFLKKGFPSVKDPNWKFTNTNSFLKSIFSPTVSAPPISANEDNSNDSIFCFSDSHKVCFHNGILMEDSVKNLPKGLKLCTWKNLSSDFPAWSWIINQTSKRKRDGFYHLAGAFPLDSYILFVQEGYKISTPLHIHFSFDKSATFENLPTLSSLWNLQNFIFLDKGAEITLIESVSAKTNVINMVTDVKNSSDSSLKWLHLEQGLPNSFYLNQVHCDMEKASRMDRLSFSLGSGLSKDNVEVHQLGERVHSVLLSLALLKQKACRDQKFYIHHFKKEGYSRQLSRGILNDYAKNIFQGKIHVSTEATQTNCAQSSKNLLLSSTAAAYTQPELEIHCGEVKAQHGATTGQMNKDEIFYLQSRGIEETKALELLMMAYIQDILNLFPEKNLIAQLSDKIQKNKRNYLNF